MMDEQNNNDGLLHFVRNDEQKTARHHCEERSDGFSSHLRQPALHA
jgi:hypothetical protein